VSNRQTTSSQVAIEFSDNIQILYIINSFVSSCTFSYLKRLQYMHLTCDNLWNYWYLV